MAIIDVKKNVIKGKIVYYGPGLCGKTTNLEFVNRSIKGSQEMMSLATEGDRTIFFDFLPMDLGKIRGISTTFKLYTVPGQVRYNLTRKMVLKNVDGVVFVADSQLKMMDDNIESLENLFGNMRELKMNPEEIPIVLQYNKRDLSNLASPEDLDNALNINNYPVFLASAVTGEGVLDTLKGISKIVFKNIAATFEGKSKAAVKKKDAASPPPITKTPPSQKPPTKEVQKAKVVPVVPKDLTDDTTQTQPFGQHRPMPSKVSAKEKPKVVVDVATKKDFEDLRGEIAALVKQKDMAHDTQKMVSGLKKEFDDLRRAITGLEGQIKAAPQSGVGPKDLQRENARLVKQIRKGLVTKKELSGLQQTVASLAEQRKTILVTQKMISAMDRNLASVLKRVEAQTQEFQRSTSLAISGIREEIAKHQKAGIGPIPEEAPAQEAPAVPEKAHADPEEAPAKEDDFEQDPRHKNASRVARVMVADMGLYHSDDVNEGIRNGDLYERLKGQIEDMRETYETRIPEDVWNKKDYIAEAIEFFVNKKRKKLGIE